MAKGPIIRAHAKKLKENFGNLATFIGDILPLSYTPSFAPIKKNTN